MELPKIYDDLTWQERREVRNQYIKEQDGKCMFCDEDLSMPAPEWVTKKPISWKRFPKNFLKYPVHLQHCHKTGLTEGAVHNYCNAVLWQYHGR